MENTNIIKSLIVILLFFEVHKSEIKELVKVRELSILHLSWQQLETRREEKKTHVPLLLTCNNNNLHSIIKDVRRLSRIKNLSDYDFWLKKWFFKANRDYLEIGHDWFGAFRRLEEKHTGCSGGGRRVVNGKFSTFMTASTVIYRQETIVGKLCQKKKKKKMWMNKKNEFCWTP